MTDPFLVPVAAALPVALVAPVLASMWGPMLAPVLAMTGSTAASSQGGWMSLLPFAVMIGIFYVLVLMPMRNRQKKVQTFQSALKVGDQIITTSGIYGSIVKLDEKTVHVQIADKVRVVVARASVGGYQGEEPVVQPDGGAL